MSRLKRAWLNDNGITRGIIDWRCREGCRLGNGLLACQLSMAGEKRKEKRSIDDGVTTSLERKENDLFARMK
ncbi:hypothetical protein [Desulfosediminicola ganghwensis]|uniref:hypothetical protein n=1 Tax=Desulfosediminicola ganghwensis TaxID=2569540 RepID=UPI00159462A6|nr:hypothetical protein [Desulfosediminicola ganghwensis]